jgi:hypothetical protein
VPAYLVVPDGKGPFAAVIWGHWYWSNSEFRNRREFLEEAVVLAYSGVISLLTDGPVARPGHVDEKDPLSDQVQSDLIQAIIDMRRGADLLLARKDVDPKRLAYVGHSYNATVGGFLSGCDHHFKAFVLMAGGLSDEVDKKSKEFQQFRQSVGPEKFDAFQAKYSWLDAGKFTPHAAPAESFLSTQRGKTSSRPSARARMPRSSADRGCSNFTTRRTRSTPKPAATASRSLSSSSASSRLRRKRRSLRFPIFLNRPARPRSKVFVATFVPLSLESGCG